MVLFAVPPRSNNDHKHSMVETAVIQSSSAENPRCDDTETSQLSGAVVGGSGQRRPRTLLLAKLHEIAVIDSGRMVGIIRWFPLPPNLCRCPS